jgi:hypothetical protein
MGDQVLKNQGTLANWTCSCGQVNHGTTVCINCGKGKGSD